ncbi:MAG TPA: hypothetical protein VEK73_10480 [Xanthobacteraceae bacterium]|nr:hypothetical protein [Xanthobacteraceae bacterium]
MSNREPGYYWVTWTDRADADLAARKPGPLISQWDGRVWWFVRSDVYRFDCEVAVLGSLLMPAPANFARPAALAGAAQG